ncbi:MAG: glycosyltransferase N-terminal domain-containing protein [Paracoccus sp. (in: a-proteobacteria)]|uniref:3-deoxy-D-manno-octulosonic acid transferase n=1 Tax=Paracoccus sp. TaxID=267 RepID=UPI0026E0797B|nr:glycosyltransferase N-terminal domain-containing protein [Paracoccus sp. (in: a-proteobacteria)]MDO5620553.1 glycosyltransferase N-terminal domain-containing protein [Paracoccus sp. (in: a-proteobacteria)]
MIQHIYNALTRLAEPALRMAVRLHLTPPEMAQRLGAGPQAAPGVIWLHAASVGELASARVLIARLAEARPMLLTTNSTTGQALARDIAAGWPQGHITTSLAPLDLPGALSAFLDRTRPALAISVEAEIWPRRSAMLAARDIPQIVVGARMSDRSARRWQRLRGLIGPVLARQAALSAQDARSESHLLALSLPPAALLPRVQMKLLAPAAVTLPAPGPDRDRTILAASTHDGEDALILDAFLTARAAHPQARLILAPRHPQRGDAIAALIAARGLSVRRRSSGDTGESAEIYLADTLGEMDRWYQTAGICIAAGSFTDRGGHTPWEPAAYGCAILHGPDVANSAEGYAALDATGAAQQVDASSLAPALAALLADPARARAMGAAARATLDVQAGHATPLVSAILSHLPLADQR